jgi:hypothetical protein
MRIECYPRACLLAALCFLATSFAARAQTTDDVFHEAESKYMFGFIDGADIGNEGEKAFEYEATGSFQKRGGRYTALESEFEFEHVLTQNFAYELSATAAARSSAALRQNCAISSSAAAPARRSG